MKFECRVANNDYLEMHSCSVSDEPRIAISIINAEWKHELAETLKSDLIEDGAQHIMSIDDAIEMRDKLSKFITDYQRDLVLGGNNVD